MLCYLVEHAGRLVTKDDLWRAVWPGVTVTDAALTVCMSEIRRALGDEAKTPRYVQTVHRRGYRFIAPVSSRPVLPSERGRSHNADVDPRFRSGSLVGRGPELEQLHKWSERALSGERQIVFVTGEPGIGKTTLADVFLEQVATGGHFAVARGQCVEHHGAGEPYLPLLEALGRFCRRPRGARLVEVLQQYAPTWLAQMPALFSAAELEAIQRRAAGATRERMLRELAEAIETIAAEVPLVLLLEDLHWSDYSTLDWLAYLARRREPARLLILSTYRSDELLAREHPLRAVKQELQMHGQCKELPLALLSESAVEEYLRTRFPYLSEESLRELERAIYRRTDGNPLFIVNTTDYLIARGAIVESDGRWRLRQQLRDAERDIPDNLKQMISRQTAQLGFAERQLLEAASVVGAEFSIAAVAACLGITVEEVEELCQALARREHFLRAAGVAEWPDGTAAARYAFIHALYQEVLYEGLAHGRRIDLHHRIAERAQRAYGERVNEIAAELAMHFERSRDYEPAIRYYQLAGENAARLSAHREAIAHFVRGLELLLRTFPDNSERNQRELLLQLALGSALNAVKGWSAPEVERAYERARQLSELTGDLPQLFPALLGLWAVYYLRGELRTAYQVAQQLLRRARKAEDRTLLLFACVALGDTSFSLGEWLSARKHLEKGFSLHDRRQPMAIGHDAGVNCLSYLALVLWNLGYAEQALKKSDEALALARALSHPPSLAFAQGLICYLRQYRREAREAQETAERLITLSRRTWIRPLAASGEHRARLGDGGARAE